MAEENVLLKDENLEVFYGGIQALHGINMEVRQGEIVSIIGANGAGKSTLLRSMAGDKEIKRGTIRFQGQPLPKRSYHVAEHGVILVPEGRRIFANLSVKENLSIGAFTEKDKKVINSRYEEVFSLFPRLKGAHQSAGRYNVRRRAADACSWQSADGGAEAFDAG